MWVIRIHAVWTSNVRYYLLLFIKFFTGEMRSFQSESTFFYLRVEISPKKICVEFKYRINQQKAALFESAFCVSYVLHIARFMKNFFGPQNFTEILLMWPYLKNISKKIQKDNREQTRLLQSSLITKYMKQIKCKLK